MYCLSGTAERNGMELIAVVMGAPDPKTRFKEVMKMLDFGFANYTLVNGNSKGEVVGKVPIFKGSEDFVNAVVKDEIKIVVPKGKSIKLDSKVQLSDGVIAPFPKGEKLGEIIYFNKGEEVARTDLISEKNIEKASLNDILKRLLLLWFA